MTSNSLASRREVAAFAPGRRREAAARQPRPSAGPTLTHGTAVLLGVCGTGEDA